MRGSNQSKAIYECNKHIIKAMLYAEGLYNMLALVFYSYNGCYNYVKFGLLSIPEAICVMMLLKISKPTIRKEENTVSLVDPGADLSGKGVPSILFDALVVCMLTKILGVFSYLFLFAYLIIPFSVGYEFIYKPYRIFNKLD